MKKGIIIVMLVFCLGWAASSYSSGASTMTNVPVEEPGNLLYSVLNINTNAMERISPFDRISENQIHVYKDRIVIDLQNAEWASFTDTNSMDPVIDDGANAIEIVPDSPDQIHVGDIMSYQSSIINATIIHRVIKIGSDDEGWYAIMKGDNLKDQDPEMVRFSQVKRLVVVIVY